MTECATFCERVRMSRQNRTSISIEVGKLLKEAREAKRMSQAALAVLIGTSASHVSSAEAGGISMKIDTLQRWANALDLALKIELEER